MDLKTYDQLTDLTERFEGGLELLYIMQSEMRRNLFNADAYSPPLLSAYEYLSTLVGELRTLKNTGGHYDR